jgi:hypothetical protein
VGLVGWLDGWLAAGGGGVVRRESGRSGRSERSERCEGAVLWQRSLPLAVDGAGRLAEGINGLCGRGHLQVAGRRGGSGARSIGGAAVGGRGGGHGEGGGSTRRSVRGEGLERAGAGGRLVESSCWGTRCGRRRAWGDSGRWEGEQEGGPWREAAGKRAGY